MVWTSLRTLGASVRAVSDKVSALGKTVGRLSWLIPTAHRPSVSALCFRHFHVPVNGGLTQLREFSLPRLITGGYVEI